MTFPVSGLDLPLWLPPSLTFVIGAVCASAGVSGAFLLLPVQVSLLGFTSPAVTPTNFIYNSVGIPSGVLRYAREGRLDGTLAALLALGLVPGSFLGMLMRLCWLTDPARFELFIAAVLAYLAWGLVRNLLRERRGAGGGAGFLPPGARVTGGPCSWRWVEARLGETTYGYAPLPLVAVSLIAGAIGGAYGIGGGALMAPLMIALFGLPVHATAGANLLATLAASTAGILFYAVLGPLWAGPGVAVQPDWTLGLLFGVGGLAGLYAGAALQRHLGERLIKAILAGLLLILIARYAVQLLA